MAIVYQRGIHQQSRNGLVPLSGHLIEIANPGLKPRAQSFCHFVAGLSRLLRGNHRQHRFRALMASPVLDRNRAMMQMGYLPRKTKSEP